MKTTQELLDDLARRSGSPSLMRSSAVSPQPLNHVAVPDASKQEILAKYFQSTSVDRGVAPGGGKIASVTSARPVSSAVSAPPDPVAEIYARLPPLDPSLVASLWPEEEEKEEATEAEDEEPKPAPRPVPTYSPFTIFY